MAGLSSGCNDVSLGRVASSSVPIPLSHHIPYRLKSAIGYSGAGVPEGMDSQLNLVHFNEI